ncbi:MULTISPECIES: type IV pilus twitching motility protein PilT [unclassified Thermoactinomyces]|uniref:type IV pilus twitching motility protein PilT n=1 Tax=unclassified Thermoactinomyces TaxID=2634588 RepID=UPI0018DE50B6|nr:MULTISPECIES: PilT/PilU family type 4a pilus ATPase [unclassified Thermoactinomyces]MBH8596868.1 PilT/PilU family type 4a pilus ATPase [Thermoactinomyces sp. CICC 10523]MBH8603628.1 PilT/PilU family type 4a pilus ATPase [Thermoactinomyces sp. CICC 10522]MBH8606793.1 PilT/PilU family type 4a pilus ATPase [Thermoactinomyces sp. CICC 10521]
MFIAEWVQLGIDLAASDLHFAAGERPRAKINGSWEWLSDRECPPDQLYAFVQATANLPGPESLAEHKEYDFSFSVGAVRVRAHFYQQRGTAALALRLLPERIPVPEELGLPPVLTELIHKKRGLLLVTGPTGSGKSTTIASLVQYLNQEESLHIVTLEDPIEFEHHSLRSLVVQREIGVDVHTFSSGMVSSLRQNPDLIVIGEMRERMAMEAALHAAEAGSMVFASLHAADAIGAVHRLVNSFSPERHSLIRAQLSACLLAILAQRLIPGRGWRDHVVACELLINNRAVAHLLRSGQEHQLDSVMQSGQACGMQTMEMALTHLVQKGLTEAEWVLNVGQIPHV